MDYIARCDRMEMENRRVTGAELVKFPKMIDDFAHNMRNPIINVREFDLISSIVRAQASEMKYRPNVIYLSNNPLTAYPDAIAGRIKDCNTIIEWAGDKNILR